VLEREGEICAAAGNGRGTGIQKDPALRGAEPRRRSQSHNRSRTALCGRRA